MRKTLVVGLTAIFILSAGMGSAEEYTVRKGDCLSKIGKQSGVAWRDIAKANNLKSPYLIRAGQKLEVPGKTAADSAVAAAPAIGVERTRAQVRELENSYIAELRRQVSELEQKIASLEAEAAKQAKEKELAETQAAKAEVAAVAADSKLKTGSEAKTVPNVVSAKAVPVVESNGVIGGSSDVFDAIMNGTYYTTVNGPSGHGTSLNGRLRARPFFWDNVDVGGSNYDLGAGVFAYGNMVDGVAGKNSDAYHKRVWTVGPTAKLYGNGWDANLDLGVGRVNEYGKGYDETQTVFSPFMWYSNYGRRIKNESWFAKTEIGAGMITPISSGDRDMRTGEVYFTQWIYDYRLNSDVRLSAGLETSLGYDKSGTGTNFYRFGPAMSLEYKNQSVLTLSLGYKEKLGAENDLWLVNGSVNVGNIVKLVKASRITKPTAEDLKGKK